MVTQNLLTLSTLLCLMLSAGDIQPNPGPSKYPCIECNKPVRNNQRGIQCDTCDRWGHINCLNISILHYNLLANSDDNWFCPQCSLPFVHVGDSSFHELLGSFEPNHSLNISAQDNSPGDPLANAADFKVNFAHNGLFCHLNINSLRHKINDLRPFIHKLHACHSHR